MTPDYTPLLPQDTISESTYWGAVTSLGPLRVRLDGDPGPLPLTPDTLVSGLAVGDRVLVSERTSSDPTFQGRRVVVLGRNDGAVPPFAGVKKTSATPLTHLAETVIDWTAGVTTVRADPMVNPTATTIFTMTVAGLYLVTLHADFPNNTTGARGIGVVTGSGATLLNPESYTTVGGFDGAGAFDARPSWVGWVACPVGATIGVKAIQDSGGSLNLLNVSAFAAWMRP